MTSLTHDRACFRGQDDRTSGPPQNASVANPGGNALNGKSKKTRKGDFGELPIDIPRDRHASFESQIMPKHQTRWSGFDDKILPRAPVA